MNDLKIERKKATEKESISDDSDEEQQASKIVEKALAENRLELDDDFSTDLKMEDELPWCELCNEDAQLRCTECDGDLYCRRCWKETHNDAELKQHHTKNYKPPKWQSTSTRFLLKWLIINTFYFAAIYLSQLSIMYLWLLILVYKLK